MFSVFLFGCFAERLERLLELLGIVSALLGELIKFALAARAEILELAAGQDMPVGSVYTQSRDLVRFIHILDFGIRKDRQHLAVLGDNDIINEISMLLAQSFTQELSY